MANKTQAELPTPATPAAHSGEPDLLPGFAGSFAEDPFWDEMMEAIQKDRVEMDARYDAPEPPRVRS